MTAGMTTQKLDGSRVSLPRAGLGGLLAATLLAGGLIGAAAYAGIGAATAQLAAVTITEPHGLTRDARDSFRYSRSISVAQPHDSTVPRDGFGAELPIGGTDSAAGPRDGFGAELPIGGTDSFPHQRGRFDLQ